MMRCRFDDERHEHYAYKGCYIYECACGAWHTSSEVKPSYDEPHAAMRAIDRHVEQEQDRLAEALRWAGSFVPMDTAS